MRQKWNGDRLPEYHVFDREWTPIAVGAYLTDERLPQLLSRLGLRASSGVAALRFASPDGAPVGTVVFPGLRARNLMLLRDGGDQHVGEAVKTGGFQRPRYELRHRGASQGSLQVMNLRQSEVRYLDRSGAEVAKAQNIGASAPFDVPPKTGDGYYLEMRQRLSEPLHGLVVGTALALQAAIGSESREGKIELLRLPVVPPRLDRLRRRTDFP